MFRGKVVGKTQTENFRSMAIEFRPDEAMVLDKRTLIIPDTGEFEVGQYVTVSISAIKCSLSEQLEAELEPRP